MFVHFTKIILVVILLFSFNQSWANCFQEIAQKLSKIQSPFPKSTQINITLSEELFDASGIIKVIEDIVSFSNEKIRVPESINLEVWPAGQYINYDYSLNKLLTSKNYVAGKLPEEFYLPGPLKWQIGNGNVLKTEEQTHVITAHEFGHALLYKNISLRSEKSEFDQVEFYKIQKRLVENEEKQRKPHQAEEIIQNAKLENDVLRTASSLFINKYLKPYNEFFADVIAILYVKNPTALRDTLFDAQAYPEHSQREIQLNYMMNFAGRDFTHDYEAFPIRFKDGDVHNSLGIARSYLWKKVLSEEVKEDKHGRFLYKLIQAIQEAVDKEFLQGTPYPTHESRNHYLIQILEEAFK